ncbi:MAG: ABC transporter ATP-binding protein [Gemmatimonadota bacterium]|nr:ABC transporter ATP-binding protein [Gemmatimonadota bacterium]
MLEITGLSKTYPNGVQAMKGVNLTIGKGMFGLLGPNGAGKSTLMRTIATLQDADTGTVRFGDIDVAKNPDALRRILGYLPQEFGVYPTVTAEEALNHIADLKGIVNKKERKDVVEALLHKINLYDVRKKRLGSYSGGMKQRFGIGQALLGDPQLVIADEPTAGLDPIERNRFYNLLSEIGENTVVILSTHIVEDVSTLCSDMAIIGDGEVLLTGSPEEIQASLDGKLWELQIEKPEFDAYASAFNVISSRFHLGRLLISVVADDRPGEQFSLKPPTLEDAYFNVLFDQKQGIAA